MTEIVDQLKDVLGKKVKVPLPYNHQKWAGKAYLLGTVIGIYIPHPCQEKELKIYCPDLNSHNKYTYRKLSEVTPIVTVKAYAYKDREGQFHWFSKELEPLELVAKFTRAEDMDMEKEV
jgi:hypothetical protein